MSSEPCTEKFQPAKLPVELTLQRLAANRELNTKQAVREALREAGLPGRPAFIDQVFANRLEHDKQRLTRNARRIKEHIGHDNPARQNISACTPPVLLPKRTPQKRLEDLRKAKLKETAFGLFRHDAAGGTSFKVKVANCDEDVSYHVQIDFNWDTYKGQYKGWRANEDHHCITVPKHWMTRILKRNLANLSGLLTLDAVPVSSGSPGIELYKAVWARQGRGYAVITERGFIARSEDYAFHADSAERALNGLRRKLKASGERASPRSPLTLTNEEFIKRYKRRDPDCYVTICDARESGSCDSGIEQWCEAVGIDPNRGSIPIHEALEAFSREPQTEVRLAVIHALRRHRREQRQAAEA